MLLSYRFEVVLKRDLCISLLECVVRGMIPGNVIDPVGLVIVPINNSLLNTII